ncbi:hypothetical protein DFH06DRAFT_1124070 [Mycena polygramma]|nr:hypothetical protein DFH06DRAFT_1124070 [Mycena polygramma]
MALVRSTLDRSFSDEVPSHHSSDSSVEPSDLGLASFWPCRKYPRRRILPPELWCIIFDYYCSERGPTARDYNDARDGLCRSFGWWASFIRDTSHFWTHIIVDNRSTVAGTTFEVENAQTQLLNICVTLTVDLIGIDVDEKYPPYAADFDECLGALGVVVKTSSQWSVVYVATIRRGYFRLLEELRLAHVQREDWPSAPRLVGAMTASPKLRFVTMVASGVFFGHHPMRPFTLVSLFELVLVYGSASMIRLLTFLRAPLLRWLTLSNLSVDCWPVLVQEFNFLSDVTYLKVHSTFPVVRHAPKLLYRAQSVECLEALYEDPYRCPNLEHIIFGDVALEVMLAVVVRQSKTRVQRLEYMRSRLARVPRVDSLMLVVLEALVPVFSCTFIAEYRSLLECFGESDYGILLYAHVIAFMTDAVRTNIFVQASVAVLFVADRIPLEIWSEILKHTLPDAFNFPVTVCQLWHNLVYSEQAFWSSLCLTQNLAASFIAFVLSRCPTALLDVRLALIDVRTWKQRKAVLPSVPDVINDLFDIVVDTVDRWRSFTLVTEHPEAYIAVQKRCASLRSPHLSFFTTRYCLMEGYSNFRSDHPIYDAPLEPLDWFYGQYPALRHLDLYSSSLMFTPNLLSKLVSVSLSQEYGLPIFDWAFFVSFFELAASLRFLQLADVSAVSVPASSVLHSSTLEVLDLTLQNDEFSKRILHILVAPRLRDLTVRALPSNLAHITCCRSTLSLVERFCVHGDIGQGPVLYPLVRLYASPESVGPGKHLRPRFLVVLCVTHARAKTNGCRPTNRLEALLVGMIQLDELVNLARFHGAREGQDGTKLRFSSGSGAAPDLFRTTGPVLNSRIGRRSLTSCGNIYFSYTVTIAASALVDSTLPRYELCAKFGWWSSFIRYNPTFWTRIYVDFTTTPSWISPAYSACRVQALCPYLTGGAGFTAFEPPPMLFSGSAPSLRSLSLTSTVVPWTASYYSSLVTLNFIHLPAIIWPSAVEVIHALTASPRLEDLSFCSSGVSFIAGAKPFCLPSLKSLSLIYGSTSVIRLLSHADMPALTSLVLTKFSDMHLAQLVNRVGFLSGVVSLRVNGGYHDAPHVDSLLRGMPNLETLCCLRRVWAYQIFSRNGPTPQEGGKACVHVP